MGPQAALDAPLPNGSTLSPTTPSAFTGEHAGYWRAFLLTVGIGRRTTQAAVGGNKCQERCWPRHGPRHEAIELDERRGQSLAIGAERSLRMVGTLAAIESHSYRASDHGSITMIEIQTHDTHTAPTVYST